MTLRLGAEAMRETLLMRAASPFAPTNNQPLTTINYQLSTINYQLSTINYQLSTIKLQPWQYFW